MTQATQIMALNYAGLAINGIGLLYTFVQVITNWKMMLFTRRDIVIVLMYVTFTLWIALTAMEDYTWFVVRNVELREYDFIVHIVKRFNQLIFTILAILWSSGYDFTLKRLFGRLGR
jgi:hypothetical protein